MNASSSNSAAIAAMGPMSIARTAQIVRSCTRSFMTLKLAEEDQEPSRAQSLAPWCTENEPS
jgi:hypothetical protein